MFKSVKRVSLTPLFAVTHAGKLTKDPMCIKESLFYLQDKKYSIFFIFYFYDVIGGVGKTCIESSKQEHD